MDIFDSFELIKPEEEKKKQIQDAKYLQGGKHASLNRPSSKVSLNSKPIHSINNKTVNSLQSRPVNSLKSGFSSKSTLKMDRP